MSTSRSKIIAVTMGDPAGIGPEVMASAFKELKGLKGVEFVVIGNADVFARYWRGRKAERPFVIHFAQQGGALHSPGKPTPASGLDALLYLQYAVELIKEGVVDGLVTAPVSKEAIIPFHPGFRGHTDFLADAFGHKDVEMLFVTGGSRTVLLTCHVPLKDVPAMITPARLISVIRTSLDFLQIRFKIKRPRIAVCGLNPHAGEGGHMGGEELNTILPVLSQLRKAGVDIVGPLPADTLFAPRHARAYDLIVAMYHDQALGALKAMHFDTLVNVTAGLPFIRTSPAHGTAFDIAGKGKATSGSMLSALRLAAELVKK